MNDHLEWLNSTKLHIANTSQPWRHFRSHVASLLNERLISLQHSKPLQSWTLKERLNLTNVIEKELQTTNPDLYFAAIEDLKTVAQNHFHQFIHQQTLSKKVPGGRNFEVVSKKLEYTNGYRLVEAKIETAVREAEITAVFLLSKWPDSKDLMKMSMNVNLPIELRKTSWMACLLDTEIRKKIAVLLNSENFLTIKTSYGSKIYDICQTFLSSKPNLVTVASIYSCVKQFENVIIYLINTEKEPSEISNPQKNVAKYPELILESPFWKLKMAIAVPFVRVIEYDGLKKRIDEGARSQSNSTSWESQADIWREGIGGVSKVNGIPLDPKDEDVKTTRIIEMITSFLKKMPEHWDSSFTWDKITFDVEKCLIDADKELHSYIGLLVAGDLQEYKNTKDSMKLVVKKIVGELFVDVFHIDVVLFIFDQLITSSYEFCNDIIMPPFDLWISWIVVAMLTALKEPLLLCKKIFHLYQLIKTETLTLITVPKLQFQLEKHFIGKLRSRLINNPTSNIGKLLGYDHRMTKDRDGYDRFWNKDLEPIDELSIIEWEKRGLDFDKTEIERWEVRKNSIARERVTRLMRRWRKVARDYGKVKLFIRCMSESVIERETRLKQVQALLSKPGWLTPIHTPTSQELKPITPIPIPESPKVDIPEVVKPKPVVIKKEIIKRVPALKTVVVPVKKPIQASPPVVFPPPVVVFRKYHMRTDSVLVKKETILGQESENLTESGTLLLQIFRNVSRIFVGETLLHPTSIYSILHAKKFEKDFLKKIEIVEEETGFKYADLETNVTPEQREKFFQRVDELRINSMDEPKEAAGFHARESIVENELKKCDFDLLNKVKSLPGLISLVLEKVNLGEQNNKAKLVADSSSESALFSMHERTAQNLVWGRELVRNDKEYGFDWAIIQPLEPGDSNSERNKMRKEYLNKLDELRISCE